MRKVYEVPELDVTKFKNSTSVLVTLSSTGTGIAEGGTASEWDEE